MFVAFSKKGHSVHFSNGTCRGNADAGAGTRASSVGAATCRVLQIEWGKSFVAMSCRRRAIKACFFKIASPAMESIERVYGVFKVGKLTKLEATYFNTMIAQFAW